MDIVGKKFKGFPSQERVIGELLRSGIRVLNGTAYCNGIEVSDSALARAAGVDRRVVRSTLEKIDSDLVLKSRFSKIKAISLFSDVAPEVGCSSIEIVPDDADAPGIIADIASTVYRSKVSIRQAVVVDPGLEREQHLVLVLDGMLPPEYLPMLRSCRGVKSVILK